MSKKVKPDSLEDFIKGMDCPFTKRLRPGPTVSFAFLRGVTAAQRAYARPAVEEYLKRSYRTPMA